MRPLGVLPFMVGDDVVVLRWQDGVEILGKDACDGCHQDGRERSRTLLYSRGAD